MAEISTGGVLALQTVDVHKNFGAVQAVRGANLDVPQGEVLALLGPNGAGKTTLIDVALGLTAPDRGRATIFGMPPREAIRRALVGVVHQTGALPPDMKVQALLDLFASLYQKVMDREQLLELAQLRPLRNRRIGKLSGGERQRVRLALALQHDPLLLVLDEPTAGMDASSRREFWAIMGDEVKRGRSIIFATHYLAEAESFADRAVIMKDGRIIADGVPGELVRGRVHLTARVPEAAWLTLRERIAALPSLVTDSWGAVECSWKGGTLSVTGADLDEVARIVAQEPQMRELRIFDSSLEDAFFELVKENA